ncbi:MAG: hypothetical protein ABR577_03120 [Pyrinomonadaceae bacterium]
MKCLFVILLLIVIAAGNVHTQSASSTLEKGAKASKATVYFLRFPEFPSSRFNPIVYANNLELARTKSGRFFRAILDAGDYTFSVDEHNLPLTLKNGETYYVQVEMKYGLFKGQCQTVFMDQQPGELLLKKAKLKPLESEMILNQAVVINESKKWSLE